MRRISEGIALLAIGAMLGMTSCSDESPWGGADGEGAIRLNLQSDARVMRSTRATDDSQSLVIPTAEQFGVSLAKSDGSYSKSWSTLEGFNREKSFPIGDYTLTAEYVKSGAKATDEGFDNAVFRGVSDTFHVSPGATSDVSVTATLANAMVSIRYTEDFTSNFSAYSAAVQTEGHDLVVFAQDEDRPAYINPSENVKVNLTLTNTAGQKVTVQPATFKAEARHHYVVKVGIKEGYAQGDMVLDVVFEEEVVNETVEVPLGDELWTAPAPTIKCKGFDTGDSVENFEAILDPAEKEFNVFSFAGMRSATVNVISTDHTPSFGASVQLVNADALTQAQIENDGLECYGFFKNVDKMAVVKLPKFISKLPVGTYKVQLQVVDAMTRTSEPAEINVTVKPVELELEAVSEAEFMSDEVSVDLLTNCDQIKNEVVFTAPDANGRLVEVPVKSVTAVSSANAKNGKKTRAENLTYRYRYVLGVSEINNSKLDIHVKYSKKERECEVAVDVPEYDFDVDAFAKFARIRVKAAKAEQLANIVKNLVIYNGSNQVNAVSRNESTGIIVIKDLNPGINYVAFKTLLGKVEKAIPAFTTEAATDVPNGNFSATTQTINLDPINVGGTYSGSALNYNYQIKSSIVRSTPNDWANVNALTCNTNSSAINTWFVVPSTFVENGKVVLRSVGYSHNGTVPGQYKKTSIYYCANTPSDGNLSKAAGELFLGSYTLNNRVDGIAFGSRPTLLTFTYSYTSVNNEQAEMYVKVLDGAGNVMVTKTEYLSATSSEVTKTLALDGYSTYGQKAAKLILGFKSTKSGVTPSIVIPTGSSLDEGIKATNFTNPPKLSANTYHAFAMGSELKVSNVSFGYDMPAGFGKTAKKRVVKNRK